MRLDMTFRGDLDFQYIYGLSITIDYENQKYGWHSRVLTYNGELVSEECFGESCSCSLNLQYNSHLSKNIKDNDINFISINDFINKIIPDLNNLLVYTGAGMAINAGVWDLAKLRSKLYLDNPYEFLRFTNYEKEKIQQTIIEFARQLYDTQPTEAYFILGQLQKKFHIIIATENRDILHQKAGHTVITREILKRFPSKLLCKRLVVVGLSKDHSGFIHLYRSINYQKPIYIVNNEVPFYYSDYDFVINTDLNLLFLELKDKLLQRSWRNN